MGFKFPILIAGFCLVTGAVNAEELNAYSIMPEKYASKIFAEFTKDTGIKVNFLRFSSGEALARLTAEKKNPQVDRLTHMRPASRKAFLKPTDRRILTPFRPTFVIRGTTGRASASFRSAS